MSQVLQPMNAKPRTEVVSRRAMLSALRSGSANTSAAVSKILVGSIMLAVSLVIAIYFFPILTAGTTEVQADGNTTARDSRLIGLLPTLFIVVLILGAVGVLFSGIKDLKDS